METPLPFEVGGASRLLARNPYFRSSLRHRPRAVAQEQLDVGLGADEPGAPSFEAKKLARTFRIDELDLGEIDPVREALASDGVPKHSDVEAGQGSGQAQDD
jgi:hypothetical protein